MLLFVRDPRRTALTDAGELLLPDAREALGAAARLRRRAAVAARGAGGRVAVGFLWSTLGGYLPPLVSAAAERLPDIELSVAQMHYLEIVPALRRGDADLTITRWVRDSAEMVAVPLRREPSVLAIATGHPLAASPVVPVPALDGQPLIALSRELVGEAFETVLGRLEVGGVRPRIVQEARSPSEALALVSAGLGLYQLPAGAALPYPGVVYRRLGEVMTRIILMRRPEPPPPPVQAIIALAQTLFGDAPDASNDGLTGLDPD